MTAAGTGLRHRDQGTIAIAGIPTGATVVRAVLVWGILYTGATPPPNTITFAGNPVAADLTATVSGSLCWRDTATVGYAADVTRHVSGNGDYVVSDPPRGTTRVDSNPAGVFPFTDGASLSSSMSVVGRTARSSATSPTTPTPTPTSGSTGPSPASTAPAAPPTSFSSSPTARATRRSP